MFWAFVAENPWREKVTKVHSYLHRNTKPDQIQCHANENFFRCSAEQVTLGLEKRRLLLHWEVELLQPEGLQQSSGAQRGRPLRQAHGKQERLCWVAGSPGLLEEGIGGMAAGCKILLCLSSCSSSQNIFSAPHHDKVAGHHPDDYLLYAEKTWSIFFEQCNGHQVVCLLQLLAGQPPEHARLSFGINQSRSCEEDKKEQM